MAKTKQKKDTKSSGQKGAEAATIAVERIKLIGAITVALITLIGTIFSVFGPRIFAAQTQPAPTPTDIRLISASTPATSTTTPLLPTLTPIRPTETPADYVAFKDFTILKDGIILGNVRAGETTSLTVDAQVTIRANLASNLARQDLFFVWVICSQPKSRIEGQSLSEIPYQAPNVRGTDCVRVMIKKGDRVLMNYATISVEVH